MSGSVRTNMDYPKNSYYTASCPLPPLTQIRDWAPEAEIAIVGAGYTGLSAALHLAQNGFDVVVLEANRIGWGASGRNGGQIHSGQRQDPEWFEARYGEEAAKTYFALGEDAKKLVRSLIATNEIECELKNGLLSAAHKPSYVPDYRKHVAHMNQSYDHPLIWLEREEAAERLGTNSYFGATYDPTAGHLHPLKFVFGLAVAAQKAGVRIFEQTKVTGIVNGTELILQTEKGDLRARHVLLCGNGYLSGLEPNLETRVMPINNFIVATRPLSDDENPLIGDECAVDSRFVVNYWRMSADKRLLFGGGENYSSSFPADIESFVRKPLSHIYPQFKNIEIDYAWGGTLSVTVNRLPCLYQLQSNVWAAAGFSGQGVTIAPLAGQILAETVMGNDERFKLYSKLPTPTFPGGKLLRPALLAAGMSWYALRDRL
ncbi:MAG: NAD(P)/FAD-dependent oxidoreductase [Hyphomicrobiales bacterium]